MKMKKIAEIARDYDPEDQHTRDFLFVYVWTLARMVASVSSRGVNATHMEGELMARMMEALDRKRYKGKGSFLGWLFLQAASIVRDVSAVHHKGNIITVPIEGYARRHFDFEDEAAPDLLAVQLAEEARTLIYNLEDDDMVRLMHIVHIDGKSKAEASRILGISDQDASRIEAQALELLRDLSGVRQ
jgi:hypothetical protein